MDVMALRRMMAQMASGAQFVKGTFTVPNDVSSYTLNFGKIFSKYLFVVEMTDESKTSLISSGITANRAFTFVGIYPQRSINNVTISSNALRVAYNPSSGDTGNGTSSLTCNESSITNNVNSIESASTLWFRGYSYNYYIVEIK